MDLPSMQKLQSTDSERTGMTSAVAGKSGTQISQDEMINIASCDFNDFAKYMSL
jgi:hypothetical protein